jgi:SAM-dependent methyltransferase
VFRTTAHIYDLIYEATGKDYLAESEQLREQILVRNPGARSLLDVACGTGGHLRHLRNWFEVVGVDIDPGMLEVARRHLPGVELGQADMGSLNLGQRFDAVICLFSSIAYMGSTEELHNAVRAMAEHLNASGVLAIDGWVRPNAWINPGTTHVEVAEADDMKVARVGRSRREGNKTYLEMHHLVATLERVEHLVDEHTLTLFTDDEYRSAFAAAGLRVEIASSPMPGRDRYIGQR